MHYIDITEKWLNKKTKNKSKIKIYSIGDTFTFRKNKYKIDNHYVKYIISNNELQFVKWLSKRINKQITFIPKINYPSGVKTPDFRIGNEYWDLKSINSNSNSNQVLYHNVYRKHNQSTNFIFDITNSELRFMEAKKQIEILFKRKACWIHKIIIKKNNKIIVLKNDNLCQNKRENNTK